MTLAQRIREHLDSPDAPTDSDARVALVKDLLDRAETQQTEELETERIRLAACSVAALGNTPETRAQAIEPGHPYYSASYGDVLRCVDREMALRAELDTLRAETPTPDHAVLAREIREHILVAAKEAGMLRVGGFPIMAEDFDAFERDVDAWTVAALSRASQAAPAAPTTEAGPCQHQLRRERAKCRHGYTRGTTCEHCVLSCPKCWDSYSSSESFGPRPVQPTPPPVAPCPSCGSTDGFHTMRNCPAPARSVEQASVLLEALDAIQSPLAIDGENHMAAVYLARRVLAAHPSPAVPPLSREVLDMAYGYCANQHVVGGHGPGLFEDCPRPICVEARATLAGVTPTGSEPSGWQPSPQKAGELFAFILATVNAVGNMVSIAEAQDAITREWNATFKESR